MRITERLKKLENAPAQQWGDIVELIRQRAYYDELSDISKDRYCEYVGVARQVFEDVNLLVVGDNHVILRKVEAPTPDELRRIIYEIEKTIFERKE